MRWRLGGEGGEGVAGDLGIGSDKGGIFGEGLGNEEAVERVFM